MAEGWVLIHRKLWDNPIATKPEWAWVWITILAMANHEPNKIIWNGQDLIVERGQWITGREALQKLTGVTPQKIRDALAYLQHNSMITLKTTNKFTLVTVLKYDEYQTNKKKITNKSPTNNQQITTNNNDNNENKKYIVGPNGETRDLEETAKLLLAFYNKTFGTDYRTTKTFINNLEYWLNYFTPIEIAKAIRLMPGKKFFGSIDLKVLFRRRDRQGNDVNYLESLLNGNFQKEPEGGLINSLIAK